jgi:ribulose-phosphate 3-epimerase
LTYPESSTYAELIREDPVEKASKIGKVGKQAKIASGLFWADYGALGETVKELEAGGADWIHIEMRDGKYMDFAAPRGGIDILDGIRPHTKLEIEIQLQMMRPSFDLFRQLKDLGADLISLPIETTGEMLMQQVIYVKDTLGLKVGVWAWQGTPIIAFEQYLPFVDIVEYESKAPFWKPTSGAASPHSIGPIMFKNIRRLHDMIVAEGREAVCDLMEDGGLNVDNVAEFVAQGMTVGEFSSPLLKGKGGKFKPGAGDIAEAVRGLRKRMEAASAVSRGEHGLK